MNTQTHRHQTILPNAVDPPYTSAKIKRQSVEENNLYHSLKVYKTQTYKQAWLWKVDATRSQG